MALKSRAGPRVVVHGHTNAAPANRALFVNGEGEIEQVLPEWSCKSSDVRGILHEIG